MPIQVTSHQVAPALCPRCGERIDGLTGLQPGAEPPQPGDLSLCIFCTGLLRYGEGGRLFRLDTPELEMLRTERPDLVELLLRGQRELRQIQATRGPMQPPPSGRA